MDERILNKVCIYQQDPEKLLSCCKNFTIERISNIRWKNRIYFLDNRIKIINCKIDKFKYKELWCKEGKEHKDDIDPKTGLTIYAGVGDFDYDFKDEDEDEDDNLKGFWYYRKLWYKNGKLHRDDIDSDTGFILYSESFSNNNYNYWYKDDKIHRDEIDPETGLILPSIICNDGSKEWWKYGKPHCEDIDPYTGLTFPAQHLTYGVRFWYKDGIEFDPNCETTTKNEYK
jgi:hypothetical protein